MGRLRPSDITKTYVAKYMQQDGIPDPDLCIRTAGEQRISNFLALADGLHELYFADCYWPDFDAGALELAVTEYYLRQRRFGLRIDDESDAGLDHDRGESVHA